MLVVYDGPAQADAFVLVKKSTPLVGVESHLYTTTEARQMFSVIARMTEEGISIFESRAGEREGK